MSLMPVIPSDKMADFKMYRELVGGNIVDTAWAFYHADCDLDKALTAYDEPQALRLLDEAHSEVAQVRIGEDDDN